MDYIYATLFLIILFVIFILATNVFSIEKDQTITSIQGNNEKLTLLNLIRSEIPNDKIQQISYLKENDTYLDFLEKQELNKDDFKFIFNNSLKEYKPKETRDKFNEITYDYVISLNSDISGNNIISCNKENCKPNIYACGSFIKIKDDRFICLQVILPGTSENIQGRDFNIK